MKFLLLIIIALSLHFFTYAQKMTDRPTIVAKKIAMNIKIDGKLEEPSWKEAAMINNLIEFNPTPFKPESGATVQRYL